MNVGYCFGKKNGPTDGGSADDMII